jgi:hypothetical protein
VPNSTPVIQDVQLLFPKRAPLSVYPRPTIVGHPTPLLSLSPTGSHLPPSSDHRLTIRPTNRLTSLHASRSIRQRDVTCLALVYLAFTRLAACRTGVWYRRAVLTARDQTSGQTPRQSTAPAPLASGAHARKLTHVPSSRKLHNFPRRYRPRYTRTRS